MNITVQMGNERVGQELGFLFNKLTDERRIELQNLVITEYIKEYVNKISTEHGYKYNMTKNNLMDAVANQLPYVVTDCIKAMIKDNEEMTIVVNEVVKESIALLPSIVVAAMEKFLVAQLLEPDNKAALLTNQLTHTAANVNQLTNALQTKGLL